MLDVYVDRRSNFLARPDYILRRMLGGLRDAGLRWRIIDHRGTRGSSGLAFVHVDLTELPLEFRAIDDRYPFAVNGKAVTTDRRLYSRLRLMPGDSHDGPVIAKSWRNSRGLPERRYAARQNVFTRAAHFSKKLFTQDYYERLYPQYRVYDALTGVPSAVWQDERLIVERFAPATLKPPFTRYKYNFFLDVEQNTRSTFSSLIYDDAAVETFEVIADIPDEARRVRRALHLDYGAIEYFVVGGDCCVIDANKTATQPDTWIERFPSAGAFVGEITSRLIEVVRAGKA